MKDMRLKFQKGDLLAIVLVVILAIATALAFVPADKEEAQTVQVYQDGRLVQTLPLSADAETRVEGEYTNIICIREGAAAITASDCPGEDCVHSGWIRSAGRSIVCLPNRVEVRIAGEEAEVDFVVG